jgi:hypothetical protein
MKEICIKDLSLPFLLSISSLFDGESWEQLRIFVGTCLGPVHLFTPAQNGGRIVRTFHGNNVSKFREIQTSHKLTFQGMPFAIRSCQNWVFTVGDDRSLRVWEQTDGKQVQYIINAMLLIK